MPHSLAVSAVMLLVSRLILAGGLLAFLAAVIRRR